MIRGRLDAGPGGIAADSRLTSPPNRVENQGLVANPLGPGSHPCIA